MGYQRHRIPAAGPGGGRRTAEPPTGAIHARTWGASAAPILAYILAAALTSSPAAGQSVEGVVRDSDQRPIQEARVSLLDAERRLVKLAVANDGGAFEIEAPAPGSYYLSVSRIGYHTLFDGPYQLLEAGPLEVLVVMHRDPIRLDGITGMADARVQRLAAVGFYEREGRGFGHFLDREEIERRAVLHLTDALRGIPRLRVLETGPSFDGPGELLNPQLLIRGVGRYCTPTLLVDGVQAHPGGVNSPPLRPDDMLVPEDVEAVEIYTGAADTPLQFVGVSPCGAVLVWTRHTPTRRDGGRTR